MHAERVLFKRSQTMGKSFLQQLREAVSALVISMALTFIPCSVFGALGTWLSTWAFDLSDSDTKWISWGIFTGAMFIYALVDRVALRIYTQLATYTYQTGRLHLNFYGLVYIFFHGWGSTDMRPHRNPRPRAYYYNSK
jgi:hypothetical protein